jgi:hypothetical protein
VRTKGVLQALSVYSAVFGSPATVRTPRGGSSPVDGLLQGAARQYLCLVMRAIAQHCKLAVAHSAPRHETPAMDLCSREWAQGSDSGKGAAATVQGDFGVPGLLATLQQLQQDVQDHWAAPDELDLAGQVESVIPGALRCEVCDAWHGLRHRTRMRCSMH